MTTNDMLAPDNKVTNAYMLTNDMSTDNNMLINADMN